MSFSKSGIKMRRENRPGFFQCPYCGLMRDTDLLPFRLEGPCVGCSYQEPEGASQTPKIQVSVNGTDVTDQCQIDLDVGIVQLPWRFARGAV